MTTLRRLAPPKNGTLRPSIVWHAAICIGLSIVTFEYIASAKMTPVLRQAVLFIFEPRCKQ